MHPYCSELPFHHRVSLIISTVINLIAENGQLLPSNKSSESLAAIYSD